MASTSSKGNGLTPVLHSVLVLVIVAGVVGAWEINGQISALTVNFENLERKIERIEERLFYKDQVKTSPRLQ
jgi:hypothetical protein